MKSEDEIFAEDMKRICESDFIPWENLKGSTILVTGATGLIGYTLVNALLYADQVRNLGLSVVVLVRDEQRAKQRFDDSAIKLSQLQFVEGTVEELPGIDCPVQYIIHGASQTSSKAFIQQPVETIYTALHGTENILRLAREKEIKGMVYLSSMEVYGHPQKGHKVKENEIGMISPLNIRNSYPISKLQCESLCNSYASEYGVPVMTVRLTQTFGPGVNYNDERVFAEFGRCVRGKRDIVLKTKGETERSYLYTADAATAILTVLLKGTPGQAYNASDESTYCSIAEMADKVAKMGGIHVQFDLKDNRESGFPDTLYMDLDADTLKELGWSTSLGGGTLVNLEEMYRRMIIAWNTKGIEYRR